MLADFQLSEADQTMLRDQVVLSGCANRYARHWRPGIWGWVDDDLAFVKPWGFEVRRSGFQCRCVMGPTDVLVPAAHGKWLARHVPNAKVVIDREAGHFSTPDEHLERLRSLIAG